MEMNIYQRGALALTTVSAVMSGYFGWNLSNDILLSICLTIGLASAGFFSPFVWPKVLSFWRSGDRTMAALAVCFGIVFTGMDVVSNFGSIAWQRVSNVTESMVQNVKYTDSRDMVTDHKANISMWRNHLEKLKWSGTVSADGLKAQVATATLKIRQEASRGGCGQKCLRLTEQKAELEKRIAQAEKATDLQTRIAATQRLLNQARLASATVEKSISAVGLQNASFASIFGLTLKPTVDDKLISDKILSGIIALFFTFGAMGAAFLSGIKLEGPPQPIKPRSQNGSNNQDKTTIFNKARLEPVTGFLPDFDPITGRRTQRLIELVA